jgi:hypothetical protein
VPVRTGAFSRIEPTSSSISTARGGFGAVKVPNVLTMPGPVPAIIRTLPPPVVMPLSTVIVSAAWRITFPPFAVMPPFTVMLPSLPRPVSFAISAMSPLLLAGSGLPAMVVARFAFAVIEPFTVTTLIWPSAALFWKPVPNVGSFANAVGSSRSVALPAFSTNRSPLVRLTALRPLPAGPDTSVWIGLPAATLPMPAAASSTRL